MLKSVTLLGSSSGRNAGDAALISGIMESVDAACGTRLTYEIPTIKPGYIRDNYHNDTVPISMMPWAMSVKMLGIPTYRSIMRTDLTLIFDAILFDRSLYNPLFNFMSTLYLLLPIARKKGKKMAYFNIGAGPVTTPHGRTMLRKISDMMDFITVRDEDSFEILREIDCSNPRMLRAADAALIVKASEEQEADDMLRKLGLDPSQEILGINVNAYIDTWAGPHVTPMGKEKFLSTYSAALNRVAETVKAPFLFVCTQHLDVPITRELMERVNIPQKKALLTNVDYNHYQIKAALGKLALLFGMRLHCTILSSSELTPIIGLAYQPKIHHYFTNLELPEYSLDFADFSEDALVRHITKGWENRKAIGEKLSQRIPELKKQANIAAELVACLHRGDDLDEAFASFQIPA
ncbi:MAG: polysaccharide pyruvyl transferase family protein [Kiritimatiellia bacterium]|nr:polysaccharide pyruvyl transferase family protein [Kiritimatiellia bacterium]